ncbi:MAG: folate-binding protein YgfZ [Betaproteobacteria bacterium]|nr:folate-binding protein YgfZ [Betaproteobacteria bacterium]
MKQDWIDFLQKQGAGKGAVDFGNLGEELLRAQTGTVLAPLADLALIRASGEEATLFLHNLLTNDIKGLRADALQRNGFCNPKGRLLASFLVWHAGSDLMLALAADLHAAILKKLSMYVLRSKVKLTDASSEFVLLGLSGEKAIDALVEISPIPQASMTISDFDQGQLLRLDEQRFVMAVSSSAAQQIWQKLAETAYPVGLSCWHWLEITSGLPLVMAATTEEFIPQMVNFDVIGGVSFKKGCYPGQEIVARTQYLGKLKRRMYRAHLDAATASPGDHLYAPETGEQSCGRVLDVALTPQGGQDMLAVIQSTCADAGKVHLGNPAGPGLRLLSLPYALPSEETKS